MTDEPLINWNDWRIYKMYMYSFLLLLYHHTPPRFHLLGVGPKRIMIWSMTRKDHLKNTSLDPKQLVMVSHCSWQMRDSEKSRYGKSIPALLTCTSTQQHDVYSYIQNWLCIKLFSTVHALHQITTRHTITVTHVFWYSLQVCGSSRNGWDIPRHWGCAVGSSRYLLRLPT